MEKQLMEQFKHQYDTTGTMFFAPGRVNLIGEHTDYNGGMVFPCAITQGTYGVASLREDRELHFISNNFKEVGEIICSLDNIVYNEKDNWANYAKGVIYHFIQKGYKIEKGINVLIEGNIPNGAGLSSSASLEVLMGTILKALFHLSISMIDIALIGQIAENKFIGMNCGIMDQFIIAMGKKDSAIALDTSSLEYTYAPICLQNASIVIMNTCKRRGLADSKYNERRMECEQALVDLKRVCKIEHLCDLDVEGYESYKDAIQNPIYAKRAKHAIYENIRVKEAIQALKQHNLDAFGELMNASHISLRDDYEVTGVELDTLVESAWEHKGIIGARMTGAGFGGCAIAIVKDTDLEDFKQHVQSIYTKKIGYPCAFYIAAIGDGAKQKAW